MGQCLVSAWRRVSGSPPVVRVLMLGLDNAGKRTILRHLGPLISFEPSPHLYVDTVDYHELYIRSVDVDMSTFRSDNPHAFLFKIFYEYTEGCQPFLFITPS